MSADSFEIRAVVRRCLDGDQSAMLELVAHYQGQVFGLCYRMLCQRQDAEDATQETFLRVLRNLDRWDSERDFEPWLLAIAGNRCRTALAKRKRAPRSEVLAEDRVEDPSAETQAAEQLAEELRMGLGHLRTEYREAFVLYHDHERSYLEIAEIMSCPVGTIKTWVHRARKELISHLQRRNVIQERRHAVRTV